MEHRCLEPRALAALSALTLAHVGDAVYELYVRGELASSGLYSVKELHRATVSLVCASAQAAAMEKILPVLSEEELAVYKRGRNADLHRIPHGASAVEYARATGLEALFGWLYLAGREARADELFARIAAKEEEPYGKDA